MTAKWLFGQKLLSVWLDLTGENNLKHLKTLGFWNIHAILSEHMQLASFILGRVSIGSAYAWHFDRGKNFQNVAVAVEDALIQTFHKW